MSEEKRLILLRHGQAADMIAGQTDEMRMLTMTGQRQARSIRSQFDALSMRPDFILSSAVLRVRETLDMLDYAGINQRKCGLSLYKAQSVDQVIELISAHFNDHVTCGLVIGHNPWIHQAALYLGQHNKNEPYMMINRDYPTATATVISFRGNTWEDLKPSACEITRIISPK